MESVLSPRRTTKLPEFSLAKLAIAVSGRVISPGDARYDEARKAWNLAVDQHPAVIVFAETASDVVRAVRFARTEGLDVAVQSTGHGNVRPADDCMLIVTSNLREIQVNADSQVAWIDAGAKWGKVLEKTRGFGLAPLLGSSPDVGAVGYTLGGGMGWLARKYGLATDSVRYFEAVMADGQMIRASASEHSDLYWGMRGGGGSLGIVTGMEVQLFPVTTVYGGNLYYPIDQARDVFTRFRDWIATAPNELTSSIVIMNFPPIPEMLDTLRGRSFVMVRGCYCGPVEDGEALLRSWRDWQTPVIDDFKAMPFGNVAAISNDPIDPLPSLSSGAWLRDLSDEAIEIVIRYAAGSDAASPLTMTEIRHAGGAIAQVDPHSNAYSNRAETLHIQLVGATHTLEQRFHLGKYVELFKGELQPYLSGAVYMNYLEGSESRERIQDGFSPEAYRRLRELKARYDPDNRFGFGFNIQPDAS
jgi:FAD/FMN-containing dehydrogenase